VLIDPILLIIIHNIVIVESIFERVHIDRPCFSWYDTEVFPDIARKGKLSWYSGEIAARCSFDLAAGCSEKTINVAG
jgi:hypothetical protein